MINRIHFNTRTRGSYIPGGGGGAYSWVNVLLSGKWAYNLGVVGGGVYVAIYGIVYGVSAFEWMTVLRFAWFKQPFPVGKRAIFRTMHHILLVICLLLLFTGPECS